MASDPNLPPPALREKGSGAQWFILGGLVVAVVVIGVVLLGGDVDDAGDATGGTTVTVETGDVGTDAEDSRPEAQPAEPEADSATGVPEDGGAEVEQQ